MTFVSFIGRSVESISKFMNPNVTQTIPGDDEIREILVRRIDQQKEAAGIVVGVIEPHGRRVVAYGNLAKDDSRPVNGDTIFEIGSITKVFTFLLLADMVNRKEVALDDPASRYLPADVKMPERNGTPITLFDLSMHSSGLPRLPTNLKPKDPSNPYADYSVSDLYEFLSGYTLPRDPGSEVEYSNVGAGLLGHVLALRAGADYESLIRSRITQPLNMPDTGITLSSSMKQRMATGYGIGLTPATYWDLPTLAGAGALRSSANDMLTFLAASLGYEATSLAPVMKALLEFRRPVGKTNIALGWSIHGEIVGHDGGTGGFSSFAGYNPKSRAGVVVLSNTATLFWVSEIGMDLLNPKAPLATNSGSQLDPKALDNYTARYQLGDRILEITHEGNRLFAQGYGQANGQWIAGPRFEMFAEGEKSFFVKVTGSKITFETGPDGQATGFMMQRAGREPTLAARLP
jgi:CubicO group peptidase (beta-lactamase class C family)